MNNNDGNMKEEAPRTPISSPRTIDGDVPTINEDRLFAGEYTDNELEYFEEMNRMQQEAIKYKRVPAGRIVLNQNGMKVNNPYVIVPFTNEDEALLQQSNWSEPIYDMYGNNITGRYVSMFDRVQPLPPYEGLGDIINRAGPHYEQPYLGTPSMGHRGEMPDAPRKEKRSRKGGKSGGKRKRRTRNKKNIKKRSNK